MANIIAGLGAQLGLDTTEFKKGIAEAKNSLQELKEYLPEALSIAGFIEATRAAMEFSNKIVETAKANEVATASVLELSHALEENGGRAEDTSKIYSGFTAKLEAAIQGNGRAQESFARLGVSLNDLRHLSEQDLFEKTINGLSKMKDATERNGLAFETLGKAIRGVDLKGLASTLDEAKGHFDKYAQAVEQAHELSLKLDKASREMSLSFTNAVIPSLIKFYDEMKKGNGIADLFFNGLRIAMETIAVLGGRVVNTFKAIGMEIEHTFENAKILFTQGIQAAIEDNKRYEKEVAEMAKRIAEYEDSILNPKQEEKKSQKQEEIHRNVIASYNKQILAAQDLSKIYDDQATLAYKELQQKMQGTQETKKEKEVQDAVNKVINERDKVIDSINKKIAETDPNVRGAKELLSIYEKQKQQIMLTAEIQAKMTKELVQDTQKAQETFKFGWVHAFEQYKENAQTMADAGKASFDTVVNSMSSALENFAKTGKLNFADLTKSIIADLIAIQIKAQATQLFSGVFSSIGVAFGSRTGGPAPVEQGVFTPVGVGSADGGDLAAGQASIVGENGPEIIVPRGASTVIPNHLTASLGGTNQTINNYNIQAIDTKSFEDRIYGSSGAIWAANQYATKNIATTRSRS